MAWGVGVLSAAAAAIAIAAVAIPQDQTGGSPVAGDNNDSSQEPPGAQPPLTLNSDDPSAAIGGLSGKQDYGSLENEQGLTDCLAAHEIDDVEVIGVRPVTMDGTDGVAALLTPGEQNHRFRLVIVQPTCTSDNPGELITDASIG